MRILRPDSLRACLLCASLYGVACDRSVDSGRPSDTGVQDRAVDVEVKTSPAGACAVDAGIAGRFTTWSAGAAFAEQPPSGPGSEGGWGLAVDDFNGDGWLDLFLPHWGSAQLFLGGEAGVFSDASAGLPQTAHDSYGAVAGDLDGDGDIDLILGNEGPNAVWLNRGDGSFTELDDPFGLGPNDPGRQTHSQALGDLDGDGDLDLFGVTGFGLVGGNGDDAEDWAAERNELFLNRGDGTFDDASERFSLVQPIPGQSGGFFDVNGDGHLDVYATPDKVNEGRSCEIFYGSGDGSLTVRDDDGGLDVAVDGMGVAEGDLNGDGVVDFVISGWNELVLMLSAGDGWWAESAVPHGLVTDAERVVGWAVELQDLDNDADLDLLAAYGPDYDHHGAIGGGAAENPVVQRWGYYVNEGDAFVEAASERGLYTAGNRRGFVLADLDRDGNLDLVARDLEGAATVHRGGCTDHDWLTVRLTQPGPNPRAIGAQIAVHLEDGRVLRRWIRAGSTGIASSTPPIAHVGLGTGARIDHIRIDWPDGRYSELVPESVRGHLQVTRR